MVDTQILSYFHGNISLGIYQSIINLSMFFLMLAELFSSVFIQNLSSLFHNKKNFFSRVLVFNKFLIFNASLVLIFFYLFIPHIFNFIYADEFDSALEILLPMSLIIFFRFYSIIYSIILTISNFQKLRLVTVIILFIFNLILNLIIVPKFSFIGAAYVSLLTNILMVIVYSIFIKKVFKLFFIDSRGFQMIFFSTAFFVLILNIETFTLINSFFIFLIYFLILNLHLFN